MDGLSFNLEPTRVTRDAEVCLRIVSDRLRRPDPLLNSAPLGSRQLHGLDPWSEATGAQREAQEGLSP